MREAGAHDLERHLVVEQHARRRRAVALRDPRQPRRDLAQHLELAAREALVALLGGGEVREEPLDARARGCRAAARERDELRPARARGG